MAAALSEHQKTYLLHRMQAQAQAPADAHYHLLPQHTLLLPATSATPASANCFPSSSGHAFSKLESLKQHLGLWGASPQQRPAGLPAGALDSLLAGTGTSSSRPIQASETPMRRSWRGQGGDGALHPPVTASPTTSNTQNLKTGTAARGGSKWPSSSQSLPSRLEPDTCIPSGQSLHLRNIVTHHPQGRLLPQTQAPAQAPASSAGSPRRRSAGSLALEMLSNQGGGTMNGDEELLEDRGQLTLVASLLTSLIGGGSQGTLPDATKDSLLGWVLGAPGAIPPDTPDSGATAPGLLPSRLETSPSSVTSGSLAGSSWPAGITPSACLPPLRQAQGGLMSKPEGSGLRVSGQKRPAPASGGPQRLESVIQPVKKLKPSTSSDIDLELRLSLGP